MEKYEAYKRHDWPNDQKWQMHLNNLYPTPTREKLEKIRKNWYKKNIDQDFDVTFNPEAQQNQSSANAGAQGASQGAPQGDQQQFYQRFQQQYEQQNPTAAYASRQNAYADKMPSLFLPSVICHVLFVVGYPIGLKTNLFCFLANLLSLFRKVGIPKFSMEYVQQIAFYEEFSNITYQIAIFMTSGGIFVYAPLLLSTVLMLAIDFKKILDKNPSAPVISMNAVKSWVLKGADHQLQATGRIMKSDLEVYVGFYLVFMIFVGGSGLMQVIMYWQMMRLRYMMNPCTQEAFSRFDVALQGYLNHRFCPGVLRTIYGYVKSFMAGMTDTQAQREKVEQNGGGVMGAMKSSCEIF